MKSAASHSHASKKPFNLTLSETTVEQARRYTDNLSATVDGLLAEFVAKEDKASDEKRQLYARVCAAWNKLDELHGTFGAEHSPL